MDQLDRDAAAWAGSDPARQQYWRNLKAIRARTVQRKAQAVESFQRDAVEPLTKLLSVVETVTDDGAFVDGSAESITPRGWGVVVVFTLLPLWLAWWVGQLALAPFFRAR